MTETKYLYGAAVQGIQSFIFQTNELRDIVGASELVEQICTTAFEDFGKDGENGEAVVTAAGNIKFIFNNREDCEKAVMYFPKTVMEMAPGITISQAVVKMEGECYSQGVYPDFKRAVDELESRLRTQRNKPMPSLTLGLMAFERNRKTGLPAVDTITNEDSKEIEYIDNSTLNKKDLYYKAINGDESIGKKSLSEKAFGHKLHKDEYPSDIKDITTKNDWIAIIHADGNGLGKVIQAIGKNNKDLHNFSKNLDSATKSAAQHAYDQLYRDEEYIEQYKIAKTQVLPIRPVVLGGDDFTMICRADFAIDYTKEFINEFEKETKEKVGDILKKYNLDDKLTACAGIAFIKSSFPFHYGYRLAESLCEAAKKDAKSINKALAPSCVMFHKVQDSFITEYEDIIERELTPTKGVSWKFGPYYLNEIEDRWSIDKLLNHVKSLDSEEGNAVKSSIRQWLSAMHRQDGYAEQLLSRATKIASGKRAKDTLKAATTYTIRAEKDNIKIKTYPAYDILSLHSVIYQETK